MTSGLPQQLSSMNSRLLHETSTLPGLQDLPLNSGKWKRRLL